MTNDCLYRRIGDWVLAWTIHICSFECRTGRLKEERSMHDFEWYMKQWMRICKAHDDEVREKGLEPLEVECNGCPINETGYDCMAVFEYVDEFKEGKVTNFAAIAKAIEEWAAKHPEPKYPTWGEWALETGIIYKQNLVDEYFMINAGHKFDKEIPKDIAEKLGITPKEG